MLNKRKIIREKRKSRSQVPLVLKRNTKVISSVGIHNFSHSESSVNGIIISKKKNNRKHEVKFVIYDKHIS